MKFWLHCHMKGKHEVNVVNLHCAAAYNFSHRIDHLSFGEEIPGIINPLDGTEKVTTDGTFVLPNTDSCFFSVLTC